jgi:hypothetical protein
MRRVLFSLLLFVVTASVVGEVVIRVGRVEPRVVIVRESATPPIVRFVERHGRTTWDQVEKRAPGSPTRANASCTDALHVQLYGDSIAFGAGLKAEESLGPQLQVALRRAGVPACVHTLAQPGTTLWGQAAVAEDEIPARAPDLVLVQLWYGSARVPTRLGDAVYYLDGLAADADGYPTFALGLTGAWHHTLFDASRFWAWLTFVVNPGCTPCGRSWEAMIATDLARVRDLTRGAGGRLALLLAPPLDRPFDQQRADPVPWYDPVISWARENDVAVVRFEDVLGTARVEDVRKNTCCHYDADGTAVLAEALRGPVAGWLAGPAR